MWSWNKNIEHIVSWNFFCSSFKMASYACSGTIVVGCSGTLCVIPNWVCFVFFWHMIDRKTNCSIICRAFYWLLTIKKNKNKKKKNNNFSTIISFIMAKTKKNANPAPIDSQSILQAIKDIKSTKARNNNLPKSNLAIWKKLIWNL